MCLGGIGYCAWGEFLALQRCKVCQLLVNSKSIRELLELTSRVCKVCFAKHLEKVLCGGKKRICRYLGFDSKRSLTNLGSNFSVIFPSLHSAYVTIRIPKRLLEYRTFVRANSSFIEYVVYR